MDVAAGLSAFLAIPALLAALIFGLLFFLGRGRHFGPLNDVAIAVALLLLILPAIALNDLVGAPTWFAAITWVAVAGMILAAVGQLLLVVGVIGLNTSFVTGGIGFLPVVVWFAAFAFLSLRDGVPSPAVGWSMLVGLVPIAVLVVLFRLSLRPQLVLATVACIGMALSFLFLGLGLVS